MDDKYIDLHSHSTCSDGTLSPAEIVRQAHDRGLAAISITDHDSIDGVSEGLEEATRLGIEFVSGCELSVYEGKQQVHILGYFIDTQNVFLQKQLQELQQLRDGRNDKMLDALKNIGLPIPQQQILAIASSRLVTRAHIAKAMVRMGYCRSVREAFARYIGYGRPAFVPHESMSAQACISMLLEAGGIPVLAHPYAYELQADQIEELLKTLANYGLMGLECYYYNHSRASTKRALKWTQKYRLLATGGSDFHGDNRPGVYLGHGHGGLRVPYALLGAMQTAAKGL